MNVLNEQTLDYVKQRNAFGQQKIRRRDPSELIRVEMPALQIIDEPLWQEDVVEVFLAPADGATYFELEVNPLATTFDARIESPDGVRSTMRADLSWTCEGLFAAVRRQGTSIDYVLRVPFAAIGGRPARANFFRVDRSAAHGDDYSAWSPTMEDPADFHVVAAFGEVVFD